MSSANSRLAIRLDALPRDALLKLAAEALTALPEDHRLHSHTDALIAHHKPLPAWCVEGVLLSPDLLPHLVDSISLDDHAAAAACSMWAAEWAALLRRRRYMQPVPRLIEVGHIVERPYCLTEMPDGTLCVSSDGQLKGLYFMAVQYETVSDSSAWAGLINADVRRPFGMLVHEEALLLVNTHYTPGGHPSWSSHVHRLRMTDGVELARSPVVRSPSEMAIAGNLLFVPTDETISVLDIHTLELRNTFGEFGSAFDCAVHNDEVYVADVSKRGKLFVHSLDGQPRRIVEGDFGMPMSIRIRDERIYLIECLDDENDFDEDEFNEFVGRRLLVLELDGTIHQQIVLPDCVAPLEPELASMAFRGDELLITDSNQNALHVLRFF